MIFYKNMSQEDITFLREFENNFNTAIYANYTRCILKRDLLKMLEIYKRVTGREYNLCTHCSQSVLAFLKLLGKVYFETDQKGNETVLEINELQKTVTKKENNRKKYGKYKTK